MKNAKKISTALIGILFIAIGALLLLDMLGVFGDGWVSKLPLWKLGIAILLLWQIVRELMQLRISGIFFPLAFLAWLFEREVSQLLGLSDGYIDSVWILLLVAFLLTAGTEMLLPHGRLRKWMNRGKNKKDHSGPFVHSTQQGSNTVYIDASRAFFEKIENHLGATDVFFTHTEAYGGNGQITVDNNLGKITLHVPSNWTVEATVENNLGAITMDETKDADPSLRLLVSGENHLGNISIEYLHRSQEEDED